MYNTAYEKAKTFMYRSARPLDLARFQYHFEGGSKDQVMQVLAYYQNEDGGFGHAVEPDCWNPNSTPLHCSTAGDIIREIDYEDAGHPLIRGLLKYYGSGRDFDGKHWALTVRSNNDYPHAPWWYLGSESTCHTDYNGTAQIAGFIIRYAEPGSDVYKLGIRIVNEAVEALAPEELVDMHTCACYVHMLEYVERAGAAGQIPYDILIEKLHKAVKKLIVADKSQWGGYICKPSQFMTSRESRFYSENKEMAEYECEYIAGSQLVDGSWDIPWGWADYPDAWAVSKNWWKGQVIIENLLYLKGFSTTVG